MLPFETCQVLKNIGFPQEPRINISGIDGDFFGGFYYPVKENGETAPNFLNENEYRIGIKYELVKIPQLAELMEACGDKFWRMMKAGESWTVEGGIGTEEMRAFGFSSEEAVANLYIALNS